MVCLPGGGMSRRYFDLRVPDELGCYSMARHLAAAGNVVVTIDPPGVGDSGRPVDGYSLTPAVVADVVACATSSIHHRLRIGAVSDEFPACPELVACGLGHSAGGLLTVVQQARHHSYRVLVLLGFEGGGLVDILTDDERRYLDDPDGLSEVIASLAATRFNDPLPVGTSATSSFLIRGDPPAPVMAAIADAGSALLAVVWVGVLGTRIGQQGTLEHRCSGLSRNWGVRHHGLPACHPTAVPGQPGRNGVRPPERRPQPQRCREPRRALGQDCCMGRVAGGGQLRRVAGPHRRSETSGHDRSSRPRCLIR